ncbi:hypothetical protein AAZX31_03G075900 [Glycine max]
MQHFSEYKLTRYNLLMRGFRITLIRQRMVPRMVMVLKQQKLSIKLEEVHDCQLVDDILVEKLLIHDVPVDIICTPTQVIFTNTFMPKLQIWLNNAI